MHHDTSGDGDLELVTGVTAAVREAGAILLERFSPTHRIGDAASLRAAIDANDDASIRVLRPALERLRPRASWDEDEEGRGSLGVGEWWIVDAAEGNVNHIHGLPGWGVTATLVRDDVPVVTAVYLPAADETYTAVRGQGAFRNEVPLSVSTKSDLRAALVGTGQGKPGEASEITRRLGASVAAMLDEALLVSSGVPATLQILPVAAGHTDAFWQSGQIRSGLVAGALLVQEAGGTVVDLLGNPWTLDSDDFLATTPGLTEQLTSILSRVA